MTITIKLLIGVAKGGFINGSHRFKKFISAYNGRSK